jgi:DNA-binding NarL/FixJ family response regulator
VEAFVRVLIADDKPLLRQVMREALFELGLEVVGEAEDGITAVRLAEELHPEIVLMDIRMPGLNGIEATRQIAGIHGAPKVVALTAFTDPGLVTSAMEAGATAYLVKGCPLAELEGTLHRVHDQQS